MRTIWKFPLKLGSQELSMPKGAKILTVQMQGIVPTLWAMIDPNEFLEGRTIHIIGTGNKFPDNVEKFQYIATVQENIFVWHVFVEPIVAA